MNNRPKILIVDDRQEVRQLIRMALRQCPYYLIEATTGEEGLEAVRANHPDLVFLDIVMPGKLDGFAVCQTIKQEPDLATIPVIIMTIKGQASDICEGQAAGADAYLVKPFSVANLYQIVDRYLTKR